MGLIARFLGSLPTFIPPDVRFSGVRLGEVGKFRPLKIFTRELVAVKPVFTGT